MNPKDSFQFHQNKNGLLLVNFFDPSSRNALGLSQVRFLVDSILKAKPKSLLLTNSGPVFCAGGNLKAYAQLATPADGRRVNQEIGSAFETLHQLAIPKAAVIDGHCFGGGIEVLSLFDFVVATPPSYFGLWQRKNGLSFGWGGRKRLENKVSPSSLREWFLSASLKSSYQARELGLLQAVELRSRGLQRAKFWLESASSLRSQSLELYDERSMTETQVFETLWGNEDHEKSLAPYRSDD